MKNYIQPGEVITMTAPYAVSSGGGALVGIVFGVAATDIASGAVGDFALTGVFEMTAETHASTQAWVADTTPIYWDNTNKRCTITSSGNTKIGVATAAKVSTAALGTVRLNGTF